jgi:hypothetical protein
MIVFLLGTSTTLSYKFLGRALRGWLQAESPAKVIVPTGAWKQHG